MLRAVRFAAKLDMTISPRTAAPIKELAPLLQDIPAARLFEETLKLFLAGDGLATYKLLREYGLFNSCSRRWRRCLPRTATRPTSSSSSRR